MNVLRLDNVKFSAHDFSARSGGVCKVFGTFCLNRGGRGVHGRRGKCCCTSQGLLHRRGTDFQRLVVIRLWVLEGLTHYQYTFHNAGAMFIPK